MTQKIAKSSVNYFILSFLPPIQILHLSQLNRRYYDLYVPVTLSNVTIGGTVPASYTRQTKFPLRFEASK